MRFIFPLALAVVTARGEEAADKIGRQQFLICGACHGQSGEGTAAAPPLAGSEWVNGPVTNLIRIQLRGLRGPIRVKGVDYNIAAGMPPLAYQSDEQIAAVLTHVRASFGNRSGPVLPQEVAILRDETGMPPLERKDLLDPVNERKSSAFSNKYQDLDVKPAVSGRVLAGLLTAGAIAIWLAFLKFGKNRQR